MAVVTQKPFQTVFATHVVQKAQLVPAVCSLLYMKLFFVVVVPFLDESLLGKSAGNQFQHRV